VGGERGGADMRARGGSEGERRARGVAMLRGKMGRGVAHAEGRGERGIES
jgi:hypothetical protein